MVLEQELDPIGNALLNYYHKKDTSAITVRSTVVEDELLPPEYFFRTFEEMPLLEKIALKNCEGTVLDIGAGAGCHSVLLQEKNHAVTALEISPMCCEVMKNRGVIRVVNSDILTYQSNTFDTLLLLMNGIGIAGSVSGLEKLLIHLKSLLNPGGKIILDSSDLMYLFQEEDGSLLFDINSKHYYGEIEYQLVYKTIKGDKFSWLFADSVLLSEVADRVGFKTRVLEYGPHYDYLAELTIQ